MGKKESITVKFKPARLRDALKCAGKTLKELGESPEHIIPRGERTFGRYMQNGKMPSEILDAIGKYLNVDPEFLKGKYDPSYLDKWGDKKSPGKYYLRAKRYPYSLSEWRKIDPEMYYRALLLMHHIEMDCFLALDPDTRFCFMHEIENALCPILKKYFDETALNNIDDLYEYDYHIDMLEEDYRITNLDYWTDPNYHEKASSILDKLEEQMFTDIEQEEIG